MFEVIRRNIERYCPGTICVFIVCTMTANAQVIDKKKAQRSLELAQMLQYNANLQGAAAVLRRPASTA